MLTCLLYLPHVTRPARLASVLAPAHSEAEQPRSAARSTSEVVTPVTSWSARESRNVPLQNKMISIIIK